jgi:hypothetical protein
MKESRFVEFDRETGQLVLNLPTSSAEIKRVVLERLDSYIARGTIDESTLDELERLVTQTLLEDSIKVD